MAEVSARTIILKKKCRCTGCGRKLNDGRTAVMTISHRGKTLGYYCDDSCRLAFPLVTGA